MALKTLEPIKEPWPTHTHLAGLPKKPSPHSVPLLQRNHHSKTQGDLVTETWATSGVAYAKVRDISIRSGITHWGWWLEGLTGSMKRAASHGPQKSLFSGQQPCLMPSQ